MHRKFQSMSIAKTAWPRLVADIGGTHARFALEVQPLELHHVMVLASEDFVSMEAAIGHYVTSVGQPRIQHAAFAMANPVLGDVVQMTNHHWAFSIASMRLAMGWETLLVVNDFSAQALVVPHLTAKDKVKIGGGQAEAQMPIAVLGPGSGLGVSGLIPHRTGYSAIAGEGGHVSFSPYDGLEADIWAYAKQHFDHVSAERLLSGAGLALIHEALAQNKESEAQALSVQDIINLALKDEHSLCSRSLEVFSAMLGSFAGNVALTLGARGGVYVCGGMVPRFLKAFRQSSFRTRFESKGRFKPYLAAIPVYVVLNPSAGLLGAAVALQQKLDAENEW